MPQLIAQLFAMFAPIVREIITDHKARYGDDAMPTDAEMATAFTQNIDRYLGDGAAWKAKKGLG